MDDSSSSSESESSLTSNPDRADDGSNGTSSGSDCDDLSMNGDISTGNRLIDLCCLENLLSDCAVSSLCKVGTLSVTETEKIGLASIVTFTCTSCHAMSGGPPVPKSVRYFDCNRRRVLAARIIGQGHAGLKKF